jgi:hypothetical protein
LTNFFAAIDTEHKDETPDSEGVMMFGRRFLLAGSAATLALPARADTFPSKQIRWVIPFAPAAWSGWR